MKLKVAIIFGCMMLSACYEPPYRYDIRGNGEGGVDIQKVPKEHPPAPAPPESVATPPPPAPPAVVVPQPPPTADQQQRINELESRVRDLSAENEKLKRQSTTAPAKE
jgi:hypothetical protein